MLSGNLGNMKQSIDAGFQLNECAEISHTCYLAFYYVAYSVFVSSVQQRILLREIKGKSDLVAVDVFDQNFYSLTNFEYFFRVLYAAPGHLRDMK